MGAFLWGETWRWVRVKSRLSQTRLRCLAAVKTVASHRLSSGKTPPSSQACVCSNTITHKHALICAARSKQLKLSQIKQRTRERQQNTLIMKERAGREKERERERRCEVKGETETPSCPSSTAICVARSCGSRPDADLIVRRPASAQGLKYEAQVFTAETRRRYVTF